MLCAAQQGQPDIWDVLAPELRRRFRPLFRERGIPDSELEDVTQRTLLAIVEQLRPDFEPRVSLQRWVFGIARNKARLAVRRRSRHADLGRRLAAGPIPQTGPSTLLRRADQLEHVKKQLVELPEIYHRAIQNDLEDGDAGTLAEREGIKRDSARSRRRRAHQKIREGMDELADDHEGAAPQSPSS